MARPAARDLTERELEIMHVFWRTGPQSAQEARDRLAQDGRDLSYPTVANLVRTLHEKGFLSQLNEERPFVYGPAQTHEEVSSRMLGEVVDRIFGGSREMLLVRLLEQKQLSPRERDILQQILEEDA